jgi:hypothetical protein
MDALQRFIELNSYKFPKGYPDINVKEDKDMLFALVREAIEGMDVGYHIGDFENPAESLSDRNWTFETMTGYLGTGFYFYGDLNTAKQDSDYLKGIGKGEISEIDLSKYKLYRSPNPDNFYNTMRGLTQQIGQAAPKIKEEDLQSPKTKQGMKEVVAVVTKELGLPIEEGTIVGIVSKFIKDVREKVNGEMLSNRLLKTLGYEGIDNRDTNLDHFGVGSVLFTYKPGSAKLVANTK